jgi:ribosomal protein S18 acetylase RimI-like enzyme
MEIRQADRADVPAIVALLAEDELGERRETTSDPLTDDYWTAFRAIDEDPNQILVVLDDGEVVGTLQLTLIPYLTFRGGWRAQIEAVRVASDRRQDGLGQALVEWAIEEARRRGCHMVQLATNKARKDAHRFYRSLGFEPTHEGMKLYLRGDVDGR